jgi:nitrogen regulatory protein PII
MARTKAKKIIAIVEAPHLKRLTELLRECGVTGFTVIEGREGSGLTGDWTSADLLAAAEMKVVHSVMKPDTAEKVFERADAFFKRYPGIIYGYDVEVLRGERF